jgi:transcription initiation factor TFIIB
MVLDMSTGEQVCTSCGYVVRENLEEVGPEWRNFAKEQGGEDRARAGAPTTLARHDMGLSTMIGAESSDASGNALRSSMRQQFERLRTWDRRSKVHTSTERNLRQAFGELGRLAEKINVGDAVIEKAAYIYRKAVEKKLIKGRSITAMITASLYAALRDTETPRTLKDLAAVSGVKPKPLAQSYRLILKEMDLRMPVRDPAKYVTRIGSRAGTSERTQRRALEVLRKAQETGGSAGKDPMGLAAAALYVASVMENEGKTQKEYAKAAGVTEVTIRNRYKTLKDSLQM